MNRIGRMQASDTIKVHTLHNAVLKLARKDLSTTEGAPVTVRAVKERVCQDLSLEPSDLMLVHNGAELQDEAILNTDAANKHFLLVRSSATRTCKLAAKITKNGKCQTICLEVPCNMKVCALRKELCKHMPRDVAIPAAAQRLVCRGQILHDYRCIGDFFLTDSGRYHKSAAESKSAAVTVFVSACVDLSHEVPVHMKMLNGRAIKEYLSVSAPLSHLREILWRQHRVPKDIPLYFHLVDKETGRKELLDDSKTLYDYEIDSSVTLELLPYVFIDAELLPRGGSGSPVSVAALPLRISAGVSPSSSGKRRSTAKCGPVKSPRTASLAGPGAAAGDKKATKSSGLFGFKKGFLNNSAKKK